MKKLPLIQRLRAKKQVKAMAVSVTWYADEQAWSEMKSAARDPDLFELSFAEWEAMANKTFAQLKQSGINVVKYKVVPSEFLAWCLAHGKENNAASRSEFVAQKVQATGEAGT
jgi:hypothetical protein